MIETLSSLLATLAVVAAAPLGAALLRGGLPQVVLLICGGIAIGPAFLHLADRHHVELFANLGLGFLFLLAGYEIDPTILRERAGRLAIASWLVSALLSLAVVGLLAYRGFVHAFVPVAIALTTTALGTLLPILREHGLHAGAFGRYVLAAGAVGEIGPVFAIAVLLGQFGSLLEVIAIAAVSAVAFVLSAIPRLIRGTKVGQIIQQGAHDTSQTTVRLTVLMLVFLLLLSARFGLDVVLGAFFAGMVLRRADFSDMKSLEHKLDALGYGFFIPVFFVASGISLDVRSIGDAPARLVVFVLLLLAVRGLPVLIFYRTALPPRPRVQLALLTATSLPLLVALAEVGLSSGMMLRENAAALVGAGVVSVALFPLAALQLGAHESAGNPRPVSRDARGGD